MGDYRYIRYETLDDGVIARITLDRPRTRNAQNRGLLVELGDAFLRAEADVSVADVVGTRLGMCGVEYFAHPWEFGPRKAKELLLTGDSISVDEAYRLGMVSKVFGVDELESQTLAFARRIAQTNTMAALL